MNHVVRISDGLGNQMFQYAFAYVLAQKTGKEVLIDPLFWGTSLRRYQLEEFQITNTKRFISKYLDYLLGFGPRNGRRFKDKYRQLLIRKHYQMITEKELMHYDETIFEQAKASFYLGFWQTPAYFDVYYDEIKKQFTLKKDISGRAKECLLQIQACNSVALHIRRTDYVRMAGNVALMLDFYENALDEMQKQIGEFQLYIFTDDKEYVRESFHLMDYTLPEELSDLEEFELMRQCKHHIIANSTFSWWAAYLGENRGGVVFAPCTGIWTKDFYPQGWNLLNTETE